MRQSASDYIGKRDEINKSDQNHSNRLDNTNILRYKRLYCKDKISSLTTWKVSLKSSSFSYF